MSGIHFDFSILGDSQPEGLLVASALVRRGYSVQVVPSSSLGERSDSDQEVLLPAQLEKRQLQDLLFRAGFFRIEDAQLSPTQRHHQVILPRHRMTLSGGLPDFLIETEREFPHLWSVLSSLHHLKESQHRAVFVKTLQNLKSLIQKDSSVSDFVDIDAQARVAPRSDVSQDKLLKQWISDLLLDREKSFKSDQSQREYCQFLLDHARKWGVQVLQGPAELSCGLRGYQTSQQSRAQNLIVNSLGARRMLSKNQLLSGNIEFEAWFFETSFMVPSEIIPEPFGEHIYVRNSKLPFGSYELRFKSHSSDQKRIRLGCWLPFENEKNWQISLQEMFAHVQKLLPYVEWTKFSEIPSLLELTEKRGDVVRSGDFGRLRLQQNKKSALGAWIKRLSLKMRKSPRLKRKVYTVHPLDFEWQNRTESLNMSLHLLDHFEKKRRGFVRS